MKTLFIGGVKSGKSKLAEAYLLQQALTIKPYYLATNEVFDTEMRERIIIHQQRRQDYFETIEEPRYLLKTLQQYQKPVLVECVTLWLNNMLYYQIAPELILDELKQVLSLDIDLVLVHNEVGFGIIPDNPLARQFVDLSGKAAQLMGHYCDKVFFCSAGLKIAMK
ncbi:MAG: bifunctional adenosylcobinamide kinase/adenosylcobinamide-phosphate guanylyltransferase [Methylococcaceae bacterium]